ncbi:MAG TPA: hypothetical protein VN515_04035 [Terriglobales bacterium]|nr:hypothetical protein [Terriglobales bacterium]
MLIRTSPTRRRVFASAAATSAVLAIAAAVVGLTAARPAHPGLLDRMRFYPGNLVVSRSVYDNRAANVSIGEALPPGCAATAVGCSSPDAATNDGTYPFVFNNAGVDGSFGIASRLYLDQLTPFGWRIGTLELPKSRRPGADPDGGQLVTSFSSKSEGALNLSTSGRFLTLMGYDAAVNAVDISNSNTPGAVDPTNPVGANAYRAAAVVDAEGNVDLVRTNAYSGNNGRAAVLDDADHRDVIYTAGNAGNGSNPQPTGVVLGAGAQIFPWLRSPERVQTPGAPTPTASFSVTLLGDKADKIGKDDNFRGLRLYNHVLYMTKGSGSNGVNTVYFVDPTGSACPDGVGLPAAGAALPGALGYNPATLASDGLPSNMCILKGFNTALAKKTTNAFPFGIWFANPTTLYVADEGDGFNGDNTLYGHAAAQTQAGLQKWVFSGGQWNLAYVLQQGLDLGIPYNVAGYPTGDNSGIGGTGLPWAPATDGLRNLTGRVNPDGTVTLWAITSTVSGSGDQGADPNRLVVINDPLAATTPVANERFYTLETAGFAEVLRGVSLTPGTGASDHDHNGDRH